MEENPAAPADLAPTLLQDATPGQCVRAWIDVMRTCDQFLLAGLRQEIGPEGDLGAAYRQWYEKEMEEHDKMLLHMMEEFQRRAGPECS
jgi:hypothetical protein